MVALDFYEECWSYHKYRSYELRDRCHCSMHSASQPYLGGDMVPADH